ncbi:MAG: fasciclin domain-containing protein [Planctomycetia bacterium]|nr:fasciclin domain-containing protein [Planctomycetia bacterium]
MLANCVIGLLTVVGISMAASGVRAEPASGQAEHSSKIPEKTLDVVEAVVESGHFTTLAKALKAAGLIETLKGTGPFTLFAPTDEAFTHLPSGTLDDLLKPENKEKLKAVLLMHVVPGDHLIADVKKMKDATTAGGTKVEVTHHLLTGVHIGTTKGMAHVKNSDIKAANGVVHIIDKVLMP